MTAHPDLARHVAALAQARVLCVGDIMLDRFVYGDVDRVSPEAPIPVLRVTRESAMLGGVGNVMRNLAALEVPATLVSLVGEDAAGGEINRLLEAETAATSHLLRDSQRQTTVKARFVAAAQQLLRADQEHAVPVSEALASDAAAKVDAALGACQAMVLSDYGKGMLTPDLLRTLIAAARAAGCPVVVDPKGDDYRCYAGAELVTPNRRELHQATRLPVEDTEAVVAAARHLATACEIANVLVTLGPAGMTLVPATGPATQLSAAAREVYDVSGAGDTVVAVIAAGLAAGLDLQIAASLANVAAGLVVGKTGTAVVEAAELRQALQGEERSKIMQREALLAQCVRWRDQGLRIGFTNGCFDLIHPGHVSLMRQARAACDRLVVGLNSDDSVRRLKGSSRPVQDQDARAHVLASLASVDGVSVFGEDTPEQMIAALRPDVLVKGADYRLDEVVGAAFVQSYGGEVLLVPLSEGHSTSATIARLEE